MIGTICNFVSIVSGLVIIWIGLDIMFLEPRRKLQRIKKFREEYENDFQSFCRGMEEWEKKNGLRE